MRASFFSAPFDFNMLCIPGHHECYNFIVIDRELIQIYAAHILGHMKA